MSNSVLLALGDFRFGIDTAAHEQLQRVSTFNWAKQKVVGGTPQLQYVGHGGESIKLNGVIYPHYRGGLGQIDQMRKMGQEGKPLDLADGLGYIHGLWAITSITEDQSSLLSNGAPRKQKFSISLEGYADYEAF